MATISSKRKRSEDDLPHEKVKATMKMDAKGPVSKEFDNTMRLIRKCRRIVVLAGAGISVSCGVPDFRSENGIYSMAKDLSYCATLPDPQAIFDIEYFRDDPRPFYQLAKKIMFEDLTSAKCARQPSPTHRFIAALEASGRLLRCYTQNIDGLETAAGVSSTRLRYCHGSLQTARCMRKRCKLKFTRAELENLLVDAEIAVCPSCGSCVKPDICFFGEPISARVKRSLSADQNKVDLLLVIGTSLSVAPMDSLLTFFPPTVPKVLINKTRVKLRKAVHTAFTAELLGFADSVVRWIWPSPLNRHKRRRPAPTSCPESVSGERVLSRPRHLAPTVFLFEGADEDQIRSSMSSDPKPADAFVEVVTCDSCSDVISAGGWTCRKCFGFDLCEDCAPVAREHHTRRHPSHTFERLRS